VRAGPMEGRGLHRLLRGRRRDLDRPEPLLPLLHTRLPRRDSRSRSNRSRPPLRSLTTDRLHPSKRPNLNIADQPPLLTSTCWLNLLSQNGPPPTSGSDSPLNQKI
jgi:hypothetical protein